MKNLIAAMVIALSMVSAQAADFDFGDYSSYSEYEQGYDFQDFDAFISWTYDESDCDITCRI